MAAKGIVQVISAQVLSGTTLTLGWLGYVPLLIWAVSRVRWVELFTDRRRQHLLFGTVFCLSAIERGRTDPSTMTELIHAVGALIGLSIFLYWELTTPEPLVNLRVFTSVPFSAAAAVAVTLLAGCATGYQGSSNALIGTGTFGYREVKGPGELIKVSFHGNLLTENEAVGRYLVYRCAEIAQRENKAYFALYPTLLAAALDKRTSSNLPVTFTAPARAYAYILFFNAPAQGLINTKEVLARLGPGVKKGVTP